MKTLLKQKLAPILSSRTGISTLVLRIPVGLILAAHGLLAATVALMIQGAGSLSIDAQWAKKLS